VPKTRTPASKFRSPKVRELLDRAEPGQSLEVMIRYKPGVRPTEAKAAYVAAVPGLEEVSTGYPPILHVKGDKASLEKAMEHELTVGTVKDYPDFDRYLRPTSEQSKRPPGGGGMTRG
jgi:hypothetical protein